MPFKNKEKQKAYQKAYYEANKEKRKAYLEANKEKTAEQKKAYREANKDQISDYKKAYCEANKDQLIKQQKVYYQANKEKIVKQKKAYYQANKEKIIEQKKLYKRRRIAEDPLFRLKHNYRNSCRKAFHSINKKKNVKSLKLLGVETWEELAKHFKSQFYDHPKTGEEMTFDNYGLHGWHIDHIIPLDSAKTEKEIVKLCHYTNLQPMWAEENRAKSNKILDTQ